MENLVERIEIWRRAEKGEAYFEGRPLKLMAHFVNGVPLYLEDGFVAERGLLRKEEADHLIKLAAQQRNDEPKDDIGDPSHTIVK